MNSMNVVDRAALGDELTAVGDLNQVDISWNLAGWSHRLSEPQSGLVYAWRDGAPAQAPLSLGRSMQLRFKRVIDIVTAGAALAFVAPLFGIVALAIKLTSPGPVFFVQEREGLRGQSFRMFKFRSMRTEAGDATGVAHTVQNDPRLTPIGRFLRRTSIDELPQLINVLKGEMSLVGPRPHVAGMKAGGTSYRQVVPYYDLRFDMLPGLTGWAQANGLRGAVDDFRHARARIDHDIAYIQNFSVLLDIKIIGLTVIREFLRGSGS